MLSRSWKTTHSLPGVIAALHLPPFPGSAHPDARPLSQIRDYALRNIAAAVEAGIQSVYLQDLGDHPVSRRVQPHVTAGMAAVGAAVRAEFPQLYLGICLLSHGAEESLAIAQAVEAQFVRLKVYVGAMVKAEGLLEGCAYEAVQYRARLRAPEILILADVYDRTGEPLARQPLEEEARQAAIFGRADALVLTGRSFAETLEMVAEVRQAELDVPLVIGGGVNEKNISQAVKVADSLIVSNAIKTISGWTRAALQADWDAAKIRSFMNAAREVAGG
jgi:uncharacterized protein